MKYILASKTKALQYGISVKGHITKGSKVVLNAKEVVCSPGLSQEETLEGKAALIDGIIYGSSAELLKIIYSNNNE